MNNDTQGMELGQHFQNYFELLLGAERATLQSAITSDQVDLVEDSLPLQVEQRITYLKGALRMGKLLCLVSPDEAKLMHDTLMSERAALLARCQSINSRATAT